MKCLFYYSNSSFPYAGLAAAMHLGILPAQPPFQIKKLPPWIYTRTTGRPINAGTDRFGNRVYAIWDAGKPEMIKNIIFSFLQIYKIPQDCLLFLDTGLKDDILSIAANMLLKKPKTKSLGELLVQKLLNKYFLRLAEAVGRSYAQNLTKTANYQIMLP